MTWQAGAWLAGAWLAGSWSGLEGVEPPAPQPVVQQAVQSGGGGGYDVGRGWVKSDHGWVQVTTQDKIHLRSADAPSTYLRVSVDVELSPLRLTDTEIQTHITNQVEFPASRLVMQSCEVGCHSHTEVKQDPTSLQVATQDPQLSWLSMDEVLALMEMLDE